MFVWLQILLLTLFTPHYPRPDMVKWVLAGGCSLHINGSTNVNKFGCEVTGYSGADTITLCKSQMKDQPLVMKGKLSLDVFRFNCVNETMTKDLRKTLKAKDYPRLTIYFLSLNKLPCWRQQQETINGMVNIELAGVVKQFNMIYTFSKDSEQIITLTGTQSVCFSDFNLQPPRKLGGVIQAKDRLDVVFCLKLKTIDYNL